MTTVAKNVYESEAQPLVFFPGTKPIIEFTITYTVRTYDANLKDSYTEVKQKITKRLYITQETELNKQYNILMHLGLTGVKFTATVSDWEATNATGAVEDPVNGGSPVQTFDETIEHVYLPINVAGLVLNGTPATSMGSEGGNLATITGAKYHYVNDKGADKEENINDKTKILFEQVNANGSTTDIGASTTPISYSDAGVLAIAANATFETRTITIRAKYQTNSISGSEAYIYGDNITITQYGRIPSAATVTAGLDNNAKDASDVTMIKAAGLANAVTLSNPKITKYYDSDDKGIATGSEAELGSAVDISSPTYSAASWLTPNSSDGTKLDAAPNNKSTSERTATIYVKTGNYTLPTDKTVTQKGFALSLAVSDQTVTVKDGDNQNVTSGYTAEIVDGEDNNGRATIDGSDASKINVTGTAGKKYKVKVTHTASGATQTTGDITISGGSSRRL